MHQALIVSLIDDTGVIAVALGGRVQGLGRLLEGFDHRFGLTSRYHQIIRCNTGLPRIDEFGKADAQCDKNQIDARIKHCR